VRDRKAHSIPVGAFFIVAALLCAQLSAQPPQEQLTIKQLQDEAGHKLIVQNSFYRLTIRPDSGATISSLQFGPHYQNQLTAWNAARPSGLFQESHTADSPFAVQLLEAGEERIALELAAQSQGLVVKKSFEFYRDRPWFKVTLRFENRGGFLLSGPAAPRIFSVVLPAGGAATGRQLYSVNRGRGAEVMSAGLFKHRFRSCRNTDGALRWLAVTDPVSSIGLGVVFLDGACKGLVPRCTETGRTGLMWSYPPVPAGHSIKSEALVVPLRGMAAVSALNAAFVAESGVERADGNQMTLSFRLMPLRSALQDVSVITRVYNAAGKELEPCDVILFDHIRQYEMRTEQTVWKGREAQPCWLLHEVYSKGKRVARFAVPLEGAYGDCPFETDPVPEPQPEAIPGLADFLPGSHIKADEDATERGFVAWLYDGAPAEDEVKALNLVLAAHESETVFLGIRALKPLGEVRAALAASTPEDENGVASIPAAAAFLWRVHEPAGEPAFMEPFTATTLAEGETLWLALAVDGTELGEGMFASRLVVEADGQALEVPIRIEVSRPPLPPWGRFGLWLIADGTDAAELGATRFSRLSGYGVTALTCAVSDATEPLALQMLRRRAQRTGLELLGFVEAGRGLSSRRRRQVADMGRNTLLASGSFVWLLRGEGCADGEEGLAADRCGFEPAVRIQKLPGVLPERDGGPLPWSHLLVAQGVEPGRVGALVAANELDADACVWLYLDLRGADWRWAGSWLRSAVWAAAWQGLSGLAVRCEPPLAQTDRQSVLWHVVRDSWEEAALWRAARERADLLERAEISEKTLQARRVLAIEELRRVMGRDGRFLLVVSPHREPFRRVLRAHDPQTDAVTHIRRFWEAKERILNAMGAMGELGPLKYENLYWRHIPLVEEGAVRWVIVCDGSEDARRTAGRLQKAIEALTGRTVGILRAFPALPEGKGQAANLVWVFGGPDGIDNVPQEVSNAVRGAYGGAPAVVKIGQAVVVMFADGLPGLDALLSAFRPGKGLYTTARHVQ